MAGRPFRVAIVGAASLAGKELSDSLAESSLASADVVLLDEEDSAGQLTAAADEAAFIQKVDADSFLGVDFAFFTGDAEMTRRHWKNARRAGASIVDMTYALEVEQGTVVSGPWALRSLEGGQRAAVRQPDLTTPAVVAAHPAALLLALLVARLEAKVTLRAFAATVFEPASEHGRAAMDELHQQTVGLLSFKNLPREQFDAQVAFNLQPSLGEAAKVKLDATKRRIWDHYAALGAGTLPELALQLVQAPVFHGYVASVLVELQIAATVEEVEHAIEGEHVDVLAAESDPPSNLSAAGQPDVLVRVTPAAAGDGPATRFWLWLAADNLKLASLNAIACAQELRRLRPQGTVQ